MIRKVSKEEYFNTPVKGRGRASHVFTAILNMKPGDIIEIPAEDWKRRRKISKVASYIAKRYSRTFTTVEKEDSSGWMVRRTDGQK